MLKKIIVSTALKISFVCSTFMFLGVRQILLYKVSTHFFVCQILYRNLSNCFHIKHRDKHCAWKYAQCSFFYPFMNFCEKFRRVHWNRVLWPFFTFQSSCPYLKREYYWDICAWERQLASYTSHNNSGVWDGVLLIFKQNWILALCCMTYLQQRSSTEWCNIQHKNNFYALLT